MRDQVRSRKNRSVLLVPSFGFPKLLSGFSLGLFDLAFDLFPLVVRQLAYFLTDLSLDLLPLSLYFVFAHSDKVRLRINKMGYWNITVGPRGSRSRRRAEELTQPQKVLHRGLSSE